MLIGVASHAYAASARARSSAAHAPRPAACRAPRSAVRRSAVISRLHASIERRQRRFGVGGHRDVDFRIALEVLIVALDVEVERGDADQLRARLDERPRRAGEPVAHRADGAPEVGQLEAEDDVGVGDELPRAARLIERMPRREVHAAALIDDRRLQRLGQLDEKRHAGRRARRAVRDDDRVLRVDEQSRRFGDRAGIALRRRRDRELRHAQPRR